LGEKPSAGVPGKKRLDLLRYGMGSSKISSRGAEQKRGPEELGINNPNTLLACKESLEEFDVKDNRKRGDE